MDREKESHQSPFEKVTMSTIDQHVGQRIKQRRVELGLSQDDLARALNTTWEQVIKYESADNPITCGRLYELSRVLGVPMLWFFLGAGLDSTLDLNSSGLATESSR